MSPMLSKGQNVPLPDDVERLDVVLAWSESEVEVDASALLLGADGKVGADTDFVFYNQPESADGAVRFLGVSTTEEGAQARIAVDLTAVDERVHSVALVGSLAAGAFGDLGKLSLRVVDAAGHALAEYLTADATTETAFVFGEIYRRGGVWKIRAVGQGWDTGLAGVATNFGVQIDDDGADDEGAAAAEVLEVTDAVPADRAQPLVEPAPDSARESRTAGAAAIPEAGTPAGPDPAPAEPRRRGVRTTKRAPKKVQPLRFTLAEQDTWQPARLFSVIGVGAGEEQERRATAALISTMQAVRPFARAICARIGAPVGVFEGFAEVPYERGESKVIPDAVLRVARGGRVWTALLEVKTGNSKLDRTQLENYLDVARRKKYEVVVSLSNDVPASPGELPVEVDRRKLTKVALRHLSWAEVAHEARMLVAHGGIDNELQAWILAEFLRYLDHPKSGAAEFTDMGRHWVAVRDAVTAGTLRAGDRKALAVAETWSSLSRHLALRLTAELGVTVKHVLPRRHRSDPAARSAATAERLAGDGTFEAVLRIPDTAGDLVVVADVRTNRVRCRTTVEAPDEGSSGRRVNWLLRQLDKAPDDVQVEAVFSERGNEACEHLSTVRATPKALTEGRSGSIVSFTLEQSFPMGSRRSGTATSFVTSVTAATDAFYGAVVQSLREWVPAAPKQLEPEPADPPS